MAKFPADTPKRRVVKALQRLHPTIKRSTLRAICAQAGISRDEFLAACRES
jgi:hypothetical protein